MGGVYLVIGLILLVVGLLYNVAYKQHETNNIQIKSIFANPQIAEPTGVKYQCLKNKDWYEREKAEWIRYNEERKIWASKIEREKKKLGIEGSEWEKVFWQDVSPETQSYIELDPRIKPIYEEMWSAGVDLKYRPNIDFISSYDLSRAGGLYRYQNDIPNSYFTFPDSDVAKSFFSKYPVYLNRAALDMVKMDYKRFYKEEYINPYLKR